MPATQRAATTMEAGGITASQEAAARRLGFNAIVADAIGVSMEQPALQILSENRIMSIATVRPDGWPQSTIVGYANEGWRLYFLIYRTSQKFQNLQHDNRVSISVGQEPRSLKEIKAVYAGCHAREVMDLKERSHAWDLLAERHPNLTDLAPPQNDEVATMVAECRFASVLDYTQGLGHTEALTIETTR